MTEATRRTDRIDAQGKPYVPYPVKAIPETRTHVLSLLRHYDDDVNALSPQQLAAARRLYRLDDNRTVKQITEERDLEP